MRKWISIFIVFNIIALGAIMWYQHAHQKATDPRVVELQRLRKEGVIKSKWYHLNHQKATEETCRTLIRIIRELPLQRPEMFSIGRVVDDQSGVGIQAFHDDIPLIDKAVKEWDSSSVETEKDSK